MLNRRGFLKNAAGAAAGIFLESATGLGSAVTSVPIAKEIKNITDEPPKLVQILEKELGKHDRWILDFVRQDYTRKEGKPVSIVFSNYLEQDKIQMGVNPSYARYVFNTQTMVLPIDTRYDFKEAIESLDHEIWHAMFDPNNHFFESKSYEGPTREQIGSYVEKRVQDKDRSYLVEVSSKIADRARIKGAKRMIPILDEMEGAVSKYCEAVRSCLEEDTHFKRFLSYKDVKKVLGLCTDLIYTYDDISKLTAGYRLDDIPEDIDSLSAKELENYSSRFSNFEEVMAKASDISNIQISIYHQMDEIYNNASKRIKLQNDSKRGVRLSTKDPPSMWRVSNLSGELEMIHGRYRDAEYVMKTNTRRAENMTKPDEFMARMIQSLYSLYYGKCRQNEFQLTEEDLEFLSRFRYDDDLLFRKGIEKYKVGLEMIKQNVPAREVKRRLEYATSYKGGYDWEKTNIDIKGQIPRIKSYRELFKLFFIKLKTPMDPSSDLSSMYFRTLRDPTSVYAPDTLIRAKA